MIGRLIGRFLHIGLRGTNPGIAEPVPVESTFSEQEILQTFQQLCCYQAGLIRAGHTFFHVQKAPLDSESMPFLDELAWVNEQSVMTSCMQDAAEEVPYLLFPPRSRSFLCLFIPHVLGGALIAHLDRSAPDLVCLPTSKRKRMRAGRGIDAVSDSVSHLKDILLHTEGMGLRGWAISADVSFELAHVDHFSHHIRGMAIVDTAWNRGFRQYLLPGVMNAIKEMGG